MSYTAAHHQGGAIEMFCLHSQEVTLDSGKMQRTLFIALTFNSSNG